MGRIEVNGIWRHVKSVRRLAEARHAAADEGERAARRAAYYLGNLKFREGELQQARAELALRNGDVERSTQALRSAEQQSRELAEELTGTQATLAGCIADLKRQAEEFGALEDDLASSCRQLDLAFAQWRTGEGPIAADGVERWLRKVAADAKSDQVKQLVCGVAEAVAVCATKQAEVDVLLGLLERIEAAAVAKDAEIAALRGELSRAQATARAREATLAEEAAVKDGQVSELRGAVATARAALLARQAEVVVELAAKDADISGLQKEVAAALAALQAREAEFAAAAAANDAEISERREEVAGALAALQAREAEFAAAAAAKDAEISVLQVEIAEAQAVLRSRGTEWAASDAAKDTKVANLVMELTETRAAHVAIKGDVDRLTEGQAERDAVIVGLRGELAAAAHSKGQQEERYSRLHIEHEVTLTKWVELDAKAEEETRRQRAALVGPFEFFFSGQELRSRAFLNLGSFASAHPLWRNLSLGSVADDAAEGAWLPGSGELPLDDEALALIYVNHGLADLSDEAVAVVFNEFRRVLRPGGIVRVATFDPAVLAAAIRRGDEFALLPQATPIDDAEPSAPIAAVLRQLLGGQAGDTTGCDSRSLVRAFRSKTDDDALAALPALLGLPTFTIRSAARLASLLASAGLADARESAGLHSRVAVLRDPCFFDCCFPFVSCYAEAIKPGR